MADKPSPPDIPLTAAVVREIAPNGWPKLTDAERSALIDIVNANALRGHGPSAMWLINRDDEARALEDGTAKVKRKPGERGAGAPQNGKGTTEPETGGTVTALSAIKNRRN